MQTHTIGTDTYAIFDKSDNGGVWMVQFLWGKKDFRIYLERAGSTQSERRLPGLLNSETTGDLAVSRMQYLYNYDWYEYDRVCGHGLAMEEIRWVRGNTKRYLELPKDFLDTAIEITCREFGLNRLEQGSAA